MKLLSTISLLTAAMLLQPLLAETKPLNLEDTDAKINYSVGYQVGGDFKRQKLELDEAAFMQGVRDAVSESSPAMTDHEMRRTLVGLKKRILEDQRREKIALSKENREKGLAYLAENKKKDGVVELTSGLQYRIIKKGEGKSPTADNKVEVHYKGTLIDGTVFDSSHNRGKPAEFKVNQVIKGWTEALQLMKPGSHWVLTIPSELAYGSRGAGKKITADSVLVFDVELLSIL